LGTRDRFDFPGARTRAGHLSGDVDGREDRREGWGEARDGRPRRRGDPGEGRDGRRGTCGGRESRPRKSSAVRPEWRRREDGERTPSRERNLLASSSDARRMRSAGHGRKGEQLEIVSKERLFVVLDLS
jgi:hypothetical protein